MYGIRSALSNRRQPPPVTTKFWGAVVAGLLIIAAALMCLGAGAGRPRARPTVLVAAENLQQALAAELETDDALLQRVGAIIAHAGVPACSAGSNCRRLIDEATELDRFTSVLAADSAGHLFYASPNLDPGGQSVTDRAYFSTWVGSGGDRLFIGRADPAAIFDGGASMVISRALRDDRGDFAGVIAAIVPVRMLDARGEAPTSSSTLLAATGAVIARFPAVGRDRAEEDRVVAERAQVSSSGWFTRRDPVSGSLRVHGYAAVSGFPLVVDVVAPRSAVPAWERLSGALFAMLVERLHQISAWLEGTLDAP